MRGKASSEVRVILFTKINRLKKITLTEGNKIVKDDKETAEVLKDFFSNVIKNLDIAQFNSDDPIYEKVINPVILEPLLGVGNTLAFLQQIENVIQNYVLTFNLLIVKLF